MCISDKMSIIEDMAKASLPMVGYMNFLTEKGNTIDANSIGMQYLDIIRKYKCCGEGNRPHYINTDVPGGSNSIVLRRFFDGLSGSQFYANRLYGVIALNFSSFDNYIDIMTMDSVKEYLAMNKDNLRFILSNVPTKNISEILSWEEFCIYFLQHEEISAHDYLEKHFFQEESAVSDNELRSMEAILEQFPSSAWKDLIGFLKGMDKEDATLLFDIDNTDRKLHEHRIGFSI